MKTSASELPVRGYHLVEGGYYPEKYSDYKPGFDRFGPRSFDYFGPSNYYQPSFNPYYGNDWHEKIIDHGGLSGGINQHGVGGGFVDKNIFSGENKKVNGESFEKAEGNKGSSGERGTTGFSRGEVAFKDDKADSGSYKDEGGYKKGFDDTKSYQGGNHYNQEGKYN